MSTKIEDLLVGDVVCYVGDEDREPWVVLEIDRAKTPPVFAERDADGMPDAFWPHELLLALPLPDGSRANVADQLRTPQEMSEMGVVGA